MAVFVTTLKNITYILSLRSGCDEDCTMLKTHPQNWELSTLDVTAPAAFFNHFETGILIVMQLTSSSIMYSNFCMVSHLNNA